MLCCLLPAACCLLPAACCLLALATGSQGLSAGLVEHVTDGGFDNGLVDMDIDRYPC
jgi:hypothetical protein